MINKTIWHFLQRISYSQPKTQELKESAIKAQRSIQRAKQKNRFIIAINKYFYLLEKDREAFLESQLRSYSITIRDFIRGLLLSDRFRRGYIECNNNYRLAEQVVSRALGRKIYNGAEGLALSIIIAEKGYNYFIDYILNSDEYMSRFGYDIPPSEFSRVLPGRATGSIPLYQQYPRYGFDWQKN